MRFRLYTGANWTKQCPCQCKSHWCIMSQISTVLHNSACESAGVAQFQMRRQRFIIFCAFFSTANRKLQKVIHCVVISITISPKPFQPSTSNYSYPVPFLWICKAPFEGNYHSHRTARSCVNSPGQHGL